MVKETSRCARLSETYTFERSSDTAIPFGNASSFANALTWPEGVTLYTGLIAGSGKGLRTGSVKSRSPFGRKQRSFGPPSAVPSYSSTKTSDLPDVLIRRIALSSASATNISPAALKTSPFVNKLYSTKIMCLFN